MGLKSKLNNRIILPSKLFYKDIKQHNISIGFNRFLSSSLHGTVIGAKASKRVQKKITVKLNNEFSEVLEQYDDYQSECHYDKHSPVWVFWMQGYDNAPIIVKKCINSIKESTNHPVHILTSNNLSKYYDFPDYIQMKYNRGIISHAQFSDILRMTLLAEYGGLWIDATVFIPNKIPESTFLCEFFTCKRDICDSGYVSQYRWTSFLNGCQKGCIIQKAAKDLFFAYWKKHDYLIDYLLVDYIFLLIYENNKKARLLMDELPYNNPLIEELQNRMNRIYNQKEYYELVNCSNTYFFKLSWRMSFEECSDGKLTYYGYICKKQ